MVAPHTVAPQLRIKCVTKNTRDDVTFLCRNQMLLHHVFPSHCHVKSAVSLCGAHTYNV